MVLGTQNPGKMNTNPRLQLEQELCPHWHLGGPHHSAAPTLRVGTPQGPTPVPLGMKQCGQGYSLGGLCGQDKEQRRRSEVRSAARRHAHLTVSRELQLFWDIYLG